MARSKKQINIELNTVRKKYEFCGTLPTSILLRKKIHEPPLLCFL